MTLVLPAPRLLLYRAGVKTWDVEACEQRVLLQSAGAEEAAAGAGAVAEMGGQSTGGLARQPAPLRLAVAGR